MTQFDMTTIIKKLQDVSRNRHFLISEVENNAKLLPQICTRNVELCNILPSLNRFQQANNHRISTS